MRHDFAQVFSCGSIDESAGIIRGVSVIRCCTARGHGLDVDDTTLQQVQSCMKQFATGLKVKADHGSGILAVSGVLKNPRIEGDCLRADLHLLESDVTARAKILELAQKMPDTFGLSISFTGDDERRGVKKFARCAEIYSADLVPDPAANPTGLFSTPATRQLSAGEVRALSVARRVELSGTSEGAKKGWENRDRGNPSPGAEGAADKFPLPPKIKAIAVEAEADLNDQFSDALNSGEDVNPEEFVRDALDRGSYGYSQRLYEAMAGTGSAEEDDQNSQAAYDAVFSHLVGKVKEWKASAKEQGFSAITSKVKALAIAVKVKCFSGTSEGAKKGWESRRGQFGSMSDEELKSHNADTKREFDESLGYVALHDREFTSRGAGASKKDDVLVKIDASPKMGEISSVGINIFNPNRGAAHYRISSAEDFDKIKDSFLSALDQAKAAFVEHESTTNLRFSKVVEEIKPLSEELKKRGLN